MRPHFSLIAGIAVLTGVSFTTILTGCGSNSSSGEDGDITFERLKSHATYRLAGSADDYEAASDLSFDCSADLLIPRHVFGHDVSALQDSILQTAFDTTSTNHKCIIAAAFHRIVSEVGYAIADTTVTDSNYDGLYTAEGVVESLTPSIMSYAVTVSEYLPRAAHGMYTTRYVNYDLTEGKVFTLSDIFSSEGLEKLPSMIRRTATSLQGYLGQTQIETLPSDNNFCLNAAGDIVFVYQPYEVASYAQGEIRIPIATYILSDYFTDYGNKLLMDVTE